MTAKIKQLHYTVIYWLMCVDFNNNEIFLSVINMPGVGHFKSSEI